MDSLWISIYNVVCTATNVVFVPGAGQVYAGQRSDNVERSDEQGQDQTRLSHDIVHHN